MKSIKILIFIGLLILSFSQKKKTIYLVRHGETNFNTDPVPRVRGRINVPLNDIGIAHCKAAGDFLSNENIGKIYYSDIPRAKQSAECIANHHKTKVEMIKEPLVIDISWGIYEGKTYKEAFGDEKGGDYMFHPEKLNIPDGETFYSVMDRLRRFFIKFWESDETECTIVSHGAITNILSLMFLQAPLEKFWSMYMSACGVSKIQMKNIYSFTVEYWNANHFLIEGEKKYLKKAISEEPFAEKKYLNILGHKMAFINEGKGVPIIFQHGNPASSYLWRNIMPYAKGKGRLIAPDLMGMGDSEKLDPSLGKDRYSLTNQILYFEKLIDTLCPNEKVILVLHDVGSMIGFNWANKHRDRVIAIIYMEAIVAPLIISDIPKFMQIEFPPGGIEETLKYPPFLVERLLLTERNFTEKEKSYYYKPFQKLGEDCRPTISFDIPINGFPEYSNKIVGDYSKWMAENDIPKLFIKAEPGYIIRDRTYNICKDWKNQEEIVVKGRHFIQEISPHEIGEAISKFISKILNN